MFSKRALKVRNISGVIPLFQSFRRGYVSYQGRRARRLPLAVISSAFGAAIPAPLNAAQIRLRLLRQSRFSVFGSDSPTRGAAVHKRTHPGSLRPHASAREENPRVENQAAPTCEWTQ